MILFHPNIRTQFPKVEQKHIFPSWHIGELDFILSGQKHMSYEDNVFMINQTT